MTTAIAQQSTLSRREFLYYIWGASLALFSLEFTGLLIWFMLPRFRAGQFGGIFDVALTELPDLNAVPTANAEGRFWLVNVDSESPNALMYRAPNEEQPILGVAAVYKVCTHLGCIYDWNAPNDRFECPCHGSKYRLDGRRIESPAPRTLDRFRLLALDADGNLLPQSAEAENGSFETLILPSGTASLQVDTGNRKDGPSEMLLCTFDGNC